MGIRKNWLEVNDLLAHSNWKFSSDDSGSRGVSWRLNPEACPIWKAAAWFLVATAAGRKRMVVLTFCFFVKHNLKANFMLTINILGIESTKDLNNMISVHQSSQTNERIYFFFGEGLAWVVRYNSYCRKEAVPGRNSCLDELDSLCILWIFPCSVCVCIHKCPILQTNSWLC